jgi:hypothetical protein
MAKTYSSQRARDNRNVPLAELFNTEISAFGEIFVNLFLVLKRKHFQVRKFTISFSKGAVILNKII